MATVACSQRYTAYIIYMMHVGGRLGQVDSEDGRHFICLRANSGAVGTPISKHTRILKYEDIGGFLNLSSIIEKLQKK
jgi:hypothetical protein